MEDWYTRMTDWLLDHIHEDHCHGCAPYGDEHIIGNGPYFPCNTDEVGSELSDETDDEDPELNTKMYNIIPRPDHDTSWLK